MDKITNSFDTKSVSEARREAVKTMEKRSLGLASGGSVLNDIILVVLVVIAAAISFTDFSLSVGSIKEFTALTLFLYVITTMVYRNRYAKGMLRGKQDSDYKSSLSEYRSKRQRIYDDRIAHLVPSFCKDYKKKELREYRESLLSDVEIDYDDYVKQYRHKSNRAIMKLDFSLDVKKTIIRCNRAKPLRLTPNLILNENGEMDRDKLLGQSGRERERKDKRKQLISRAFMVIFGGMIVVDIIFDFSLLTIFQWVIRMMPVISAIVTGDDAGYCNITVTETNFKKDQVSVINLFFEHAGTEKEACAKPEE